MVFDVVSISPSVSSSLMLVRGLFVCFFFLIWKLKRCYGIFYFICAKIVICKRILRILVGFGVPISSSVSSSLMLVRGIVCKFSIFTCGVLYFICAKIVFSK